MMIFYMLSFWGAFFFFLFVSHIEYDEKQIGP
jgi:hypothetical protein